MGSHSLEVYQADRSADATPEATLDDQSSLGKRSKVLLSIAFCCLILLVVGAYFGIERALTKETQPSRVDVLPCFWQTFLANGKPTYVVIPRLTFFSLNPNLIVRDPEVNNPSEWKRSASLAPIMQQSTFVSSIRTYAVADDALGAVSLVSFFNARNLPVTLTAFADAPADLLANGNLIAIGTSRTLSGFEQSYVSSDVLLDFRLVPGERCVQNSRPADGEPKQFLFRAESPTRSIWPCTLDILPGRNRNTKVMIVKSGNTQAPVTFLTSPAGLDRLEKMWKAGGSPRYFEVVLEYEMNESQCLLTWPLTMHALAAHD
jgi:hypothetical protein